MIHDHEQEAEALTLHMQENPEVRDQLRRIGGLWNDAAAPPPFENAPGAANGDINESDQEDPQASQSSNDEDSDATIPSTWQVENSNSLSHPEMHNQDQTTSGIYKQFTSLTC